MTASPSYPDYGLLFSEIIAMNSWSMCNTQPPRKSRGGIDLGFRENDTRDYISSGLRRSAATLPADCPTLLVETKLTQDENPGRVDYCFVGRGWPDSRSVLATCEAKGPVRKSFFRLESFPRNWSRVFVEDVQKQLRRGRTHNHAKHYIALLLPFTESWIRNSSYPFILRRTVEQVPGVALVECAAKEVSLKNGLPLTVIVIRVEAAV